MSSAKTEKTNSPHVMKISGDKDKATGKPCIDFQPDDSWQLKDEESDDTNKRRKSLRKRKLNSHGVTEKVVTVNGESSKMDVDDEELSKSSNIEDDQKCDGTVSDTENSSHKENGPASKRLRSSSSSSNLSKKTASKTDSSKNKNGVEDIASDSCDSLLENSKDSNGKPDASDSKIPTAAPLLEDERTKSDVEGDDKSGSEENSNKNETMPSLSSNDNSRSSDKKDDADITIIEDVESDGEVQIIDSTSKETPQSSAIVEEKLYQQSLSADAKLSKEELLLSSGFPYFNSLREKVAGFQAGKFKPVKFPHMGTLMLEENEVIIESPSLLVPLLIKEADQFPTLDEDSSSTNSDNVSIAKLKTFRRNFFQSSVGQFLINLGASRVLEWYHKDMKRSKHRELRKAGGESREIEDSLEWHSKKLKATKDANVAFTFPPQKCSLCNFKTESRLVMEGHFLTPHFSSRREFICSFCSFLTRDLKEIAFHFEAIHQRKIMTEDQMQLHECLFCSFHSNLRSKVNIHMNRCRRNFLPSQNQSPPFDFEFPGVTTKPVTIADVIAHRRMLMGSAKAPFSGAGQASALDNAASALARKKLASVLSLTGAESFADSPTLIKHLMGSQAKQSSSGFQLPPGIVLTRPRVRGQVRQPIPNMQPNMQALRPSSARGGTPFASNIGPTHLTSSGISITPIGKQDSSTRQTQPSGKNITLTPISSAGNQVVSQKPGPPQPVALFTNVAGSDMKARPGLQMGITARMPAAVAGRPARLMQPFQRLNTPPSQVVKNSSGGSFVLCEICDSYIKDLEELRSHMNWVHKVKIHPKMLVSRPPLNCQKCQWRFFTDQGLERHLLGAHGLVTTNMQEMANKNQDGGRCIICGAVFTYKLVSHMTQVHKVTLKPAHLSYKCTVCTATFTLYRLFESHVYNVHSASAKRPVEDSTASEPPAKKSAPEPKPEMKKEEDSSIKCSHCNKIVDDLHKHLIAKHMMDCRVKLCRIEKCEKCLYSSGEMLILHLSDFEDDSGSEDESSDEESDSKDDEA